MSAYDTNLERVSQRPVHRCGSNNCPIAKFNACVAYLENCKWGWENEEEVLTSLENHDAIGFLRNTGPDPMANHKTYQPTFNVGPPTARSSVKRQLGCLSGPQGFTCWICFAPVFSFIYC